MAADMFKYAERCLYEFQGNRARIEKLRETLAALYMSTSMRGQAWEETQHNGEPGNPVAVRGLRIVTLEEEIKRLTGRVEPIEKLMTALEVPFVLEGTPLERLPKLIRLWYFAKLPRDRIASTLGVSRSAMFRLRQKAVELTRKYLGV